MESPRRSRKEKDWDLNVDLKPMMDVLTVLIPFLVVFASFASIKILEVNLPENQMMVTQPKDKDDEGLLLTIFVSDEGITLGAKGAILPTTYAHELHKYVYTYPLGQNHLETFYQRIIGGNNKELPVCPQDPKRRLTLLEREEIILYVVNKESKQDTGQWVMALYNKAGETLANKERVILNALPKVGDTLFTLSLMNTRMEVVRNPGEYALGRLSLYDQLAVRLLRVQAMYPDAPDLGEIKIVAEDEVMFDKIIHVMDVCRDFGYPKISLGKLAG